MPPAPRGFGANETPTGGDGDDEGSAGGKRDAEGKRGGRAKSAADSAPPNAAATGIVIVIASHQSGRAKW